MKNNQISEGKELEKELKKIKDARERQQFLFRADELLPQNIVDVEREKHELRNGVEFTIKDIKDVINELARQYEPMFPNSKPFFKLMYKLSGWDELNPNNFVKPPVVARYIKQYVYARFPREILPALVAKDNPFVSGYIRRYKLFQFLNDDGIRLMDGYIQDAINVMESSKDWRDFERRYTTKFHLSLQLNLNDPH